MQIEGRKNHLVVEFQGLNGYIIFFKEGGVQCLDVPFEDLPHALREYIKECKEVSKFEERTTNLGIGPGGSKVNILLYSLDY